MKLTLVDGTEMTISPGGALMGLMIAKVELDAKDAFLITRGSYEDFADWFEHLLNCRIYPANEEVG